MLLRLMRGSASSSPVILICESDRSPQGQDFGAFSQGLGSRERGLQSKFAKVLF